MDAKNHNYASEISSPDLFTALCGFTSFVTNASSVLTVKRELRPVEVSVLASLLASGAQISHLVLEKELPSGSATKLGPAIKSSTTTGTLRALTLGYLRQGNSVLAPELFLTLAASVNPILEELSIHHIRTTDSCIRHVCNSLGQFAALRSLAIYSPTPQMITEIGKLQTLESLRITRKEHDGLQTETLPATLTNLPLLTELKICKFQILAKTIQTIGGLVGLGRIRKLDLSEDYLDDEGVSAIVDAIVASQKIHSRPIELQELNLYCNIFCSKGEQAIAEKLQLPHLRVLNLSKNCICDDFHKLRAVQSLEELNINLCGFDARKIQSVLDMSLPKLRVLKMDECSVGDIGAHAVARLLPASPLTELHMMCNSIREAGALELAGAFARTYTLKRLYMADNSVTRRGATAIIDALAAAFTMPMDMIDFSGCGIQDEGAKAMGRLISRRGCRSMCLYRSYIGAAGTKAIADSIATSACSIQILNLSHNMIGDEGVEYLLNKITYPQNRSVQKLNIADNKMGVKGVMAAKRVVEAPGVLRKLKVGSCMGSKEACGALREVVMWERTSKSTEVAMIIRLGHEDINFSK